MIGMGAKFILALDEGTTSARAILFDQDGKAKGLGQNIFQQLYPNPGWVEQKPEDIWQAQKNSIKKALKSAKTELKKVAAIGITNQRETTVLWEKHTGKPIYNAIVWQCKRTTDAVEYLKLEYGEVFKEKTGLIPDSYFSGPKIIWILENIGGMRERAEKGEILFGTIDSFLLFRLSGGKIHATDYSNASRTLLFNIHSLEWDEELLEILKIPSSMLPEVKPSSEIFGYTSKEVLGSSLPISGIAGDQQAALFGHTGFNQGDSKCTYGTGNFLLMNTGQKPISSETLLTTIAWSLDDKIVYALEGSVFVTGAAIQWLRDSIRIIDNVEESDDLARSLNSSDGVYFVPAFTGLGAPYWDQYARGTITGISRGTERAHIIRAALEGIAYLTKDVVETMKSDSMMEIGSLRVDGGATRNNFLMQFQSDILNLTILRPFEIEATARGVAFLAGLKIDYWKSQEELMGLGLEVEEFRPSMPEKMRKSLYKGWRVAVEKTLSKKNYGVSSYG
jgi:glycerol kinase